MSLKTIESILVQNLTMRQKIKQHFIGLLLDIEDGLWFGHFMLLSPPGTTSSFLLNVITDSMGNIIYFLICYYIEIITLEEGEIFLYSNRK